MRNTMFGSVLGQGNGGGECPEGQAMILGQCATAAIACLNDDGTYRVIEIEEWHGRQGTNVPTGRILAESATQDEFRAMGIERVVFLDAEESECSGGPNNEHSACLRISGYHDLVDPVTGQVLQSGIIYTDLPPNTLSLPQVGTVCIPCPAGMDPHESGYGCCEPAEYVQNENGECVRTRVCHHPGAQQDYAEGMPDNPDWFPDGYTPRPPDIVEDMVGAETCGIPGNGSGGAWDTGDAGDAEGDGPSTALVAGGAAVLVAVGVAIWG